MSQLYVLFNIYDMGFLLSMKTWVLRGMLFGNREVVFVSCHSENYSVSYSAVLEAAQAAMEMAPHPQAAAHLNR